MRSRSVLVGEQDAVTPSACPILRPMCLASFLVSAVANIAKKNGTRGKIGFAITGANHVTAQKTCCMGTIRIEAKTRGRVISVVLRRH